MERVKALAKYRSQKGGAKSRGISWELTFDQWLEWWGPDIEKRGKATSALQMLRFGDIGPYAVGNVYKGTPKENISTAGRLRRNRSSEKAKQSHQDYLNALMWAESEESDEEDLYSEDELELLKTTGGVTSPRRGAEFAIDKNR